MEILSSSSVESPTLDCYLLTLAPHIPQVLISAHQYQNINEIAKRLPTLRVAGFETDLLNSHTDFAVRLAGSELHAAKRNQFDALASSDADSAWSRVLATVDHPTVRDQWLEFDVEPNNSLFPTPSIFFGLNDASTLERFTSAPKDVCGLVQQLALNSVPTQTMQLFDRVYQALPTIAHVFQVGLMLGRPERGLRVVIRGLAAEAMAGFLNHVKWPGNIHAVVETAKFWQQFSDWIFLSVDVGNELGPRIGLVLKFYRHITGYDPRWNRILSELQTSEYCSSEHKEALLNWPGVTRESNCELNWPEHLKSVATLFSNETEPVFKRILNHAKIVLMDGEISTVKIYYGYYLDWN